MPKTYTIYITSHALTKGILKMEAVKDEKCGGQFPWRLYGMPFSTYTYKEGNDYHFTAEAALAHAEGMRQRKVAPLRKQLHRLENLTIAIVTVENQCL